MSTDDAREFQRIYKSVYCGTAAYTGENFSNNAVIKKIASPDILDAYVKCKGIENGGLKVNLNIRPQDNKVFVLDVTYTKAWGNPTGPKVKKVSFVPNVISTRQGTLQDGVGLKTGITFSMICERSTDIPLTVYLETEVGTYSANLPAFIPPPTDQERVMAALPRGTILGWYDATRIPRGWALCDGMTGTPNLVGRFVMGTNNVGELGTSHPNSSLPHSHRLSSIPTEEYGKWLRPEGGDVTSKGLMEFKGSSGSFWLHGHKVTGNTDPSDWLPPSTRILFIIKL
jgi:hypothetical protein